MYYVLKKFLPPKLAMMKISAYSPPWDGRPCLGIYYVFILDLE